MILLGTNVGPQGEAYSEKDLLTRLGAARHSRDVARRAVEIARADVDRERTAASIVISKELKPAHAANVRELAHALIALGKAAETEASLRERLMDADVMFLSNIRPMAITALGSPRDRNSLFASWLMEAIEHGFIEKTVVPAEWRARWM
jgi:hypothetical protein